MRKTIFGDIRGLDKKAFRAKLIAAADRCAAAKTDVDFERQQQREALRQRQALCETYLMSRRALGAVFGSFPARPEPETKRELNPAYAPEPVGAD